MTITFAQAKALYAALTPAKQAELRALVAADTAIWRPLPGPQTQAYYSRADIVGYGGAAGGGKTDLLCGLMLTQHRKGMILRRVGTEITGIEDRLTELIGNRDGYNSTKRIWRERLNGRDVQIEFASLPNPGDEKGYQGRPHDLLCFDEAANFLEAQVRFLLGWVRTTTPGQRCRVLMTFNPPTTTEGRWILKFFAPWLDPNFRDRAAPGELRWCAMVPQAQGPSRDIWVEDDRPFVLVEGKPCYDFDPAAYPATEIIQPRSRTFIPSRLTDNPYLMETGYMSTLQAMPEPLRSQMLYGDFQAGMKDDAMQVIPTAWVDAAMKRWTRPAVLPAMDSLGVDVARGGDDRTVIARRHGIWFDEPLTYPGAVTPDGPAIAGLVVAALRDRAPIHIDVIGVGASPYDFLKAARQQVIGVNVAESTNETDLSGRLRFSNQRSKDWWRMREALDPANNRGIALPPSEELRTELCAPLWEARGPVIHVEGRDAIIKRVGRSADLASAYLLALRDTSRREDVMTRASGAQSRARGEYDPYAQR